LLNSAADWAQLVSQLELGGLAIELARHCALGHWDGASLQLVLAPAHLHLRTPGSEQRLAEALGVALGCAPRLEIVTDQAQDETPALRRARDDAQRLAEAERSLHEDPVAQLLRERFDAEWVLGSVSALPAAGA
jgi:DNA polymerase-3 subunit gamma/tau